MVEIKQLGNLDQYKSILEQSDFQTSRSNEINSQGDDQEFFSSLKESTIRFADGSSGQLEKDSYLKLLMAELQNQNPLDPFDHQQMASQLAQFHSVEELSSIRDQMEALNRQVSASSATPSLEVDSLYLKEGSQLRQWEAQGPYGVVFNIENPEEAHQLSFWNEAGDLVHSETKTFSKIGLQVVSWDSHELKNLGLDDRSVSVTCEKKGVPCLSYELFDPVGLQINSENKNILLLNNHGQKENIKDWPITLKKQKLQHYQSLGDQL
jgi:flagellar hook assembly protein FlgD